MNDGTRAKCRERIAAALRGNAAFAAAHNDPGAVEAAATRCEAHCYSSAHARAVYFNEVANAVRLAGTVSDTGELYRIASGTSKQVASGNTCCLVGPVASMRLKTRIDTGDVVDEVSHLALQGMW